MSGLTRAVVEVAGQPAGDLVVPGRSDPSVFVYRAGVPEGRAVSVTMPVSEQAYSYNGVHPVFAQNLPEGYLGDVIRKHVAKLYGAGDLAVLAALGRHQVGRVVVTDSVLSDQTVDGQGETLSRLLKTDDASLFDELVEKYALRSGVSGVQPKVLIPSHIPEKSSVRTSGFIVKTWGEDYPQLAANEYFCMTLARQCGLPVPEFYLSENGRLFVMSRFDRRSSDPGTFGQGSEEQWLGFEDACVLQGLMPEDKYSGSYEKLARTFGVYLSSEHRRDGLKWLFMSLALSWAVRNGDAHLKNFGLLYEQPFDERWMAPTYDIVSTTPYLPSDVPALTLAGRKVWWPVEYLIKFGCQSCGLARKEAKACLQDLAGNLDSTADQIQAYYTRHPAFQAVGKDMESTFRANALLLRDALTR